MNSRMLIGLALVGAGAYLGWKYLQGKKPALPAVSNADAVRNALVAQGLVSSSPRPSPLAPSNARIAPSLTQQAFALVPGAT